MFGDNPNTPYGLMALGQGLSQLGTGQPVNMAPAMDAMMQRKERADMKRSLQESGVLNRFTPEQRAILASMPPSAAQQVIASVLFREPAAPKVTDDMAEFEYAKQYGGYQGTLQDWILDQKKAGATSITNNVGPTGIDYGDPPKDMVWARTPDGSVQLDERGAPIAYVVRGSETDRKQVESTVNRAGEAIDAADTEQNRESLALTASENVVTAAARAREAAGNRNLGSTGTTVVGQLPWTDSAEVLRQTSALKSMAAAENLNAMRQASPTGGALGNVTEKELKLLQDKSGALDPESPNYLRDLADYERTLLRTIHGKEMGDRIFEQTRPTAPSDSGTPDFSAMSDEELDAWIKANGG